MHLYALLLYKDTKFSPDLPYYIIDNQMIELIFYTSSRRHPLASFDSESGGRKLLLLSAYWVSE